MELLIVLAIIALASAVLIPRIGHNDGKLYQVQLRTLSNALNYNRRNAVILNRPYEMNVFPYQEADEGKEENKSARAIKKGDWRSQGAVIQWQTGSRIVPNKPFKITYFPQGGATGGVIRLQQGRFIALLTIDGITGKVTIKESNEDAEN